MEEVQTEIILSVYILSFLMGLPANLLALYAFSTKIHSRPLPIDILLLNLTVSDLLFLCVLPLKMYEAASGMTWSLPDFLCSITSFIFFCTIYTSSLLLTAVTVVRYVAVAFPVTYQRLQRPLYAILCSVLIWVVSAAHCSITFIAQHHPSLSRHNSTRCYEGFSDKQLQVSRLRPCSSLPVLFVPSLLLPLCPCTTANTPLLTQRLIYLHFCTCSLILVPLRLEFFFVLCLIPLLICVFCYLRCIYLLYSRPRFSPQLKQRVMGMALGTLAVFLVCMLPYNLTHLLGYVKGQSLVWRYYTLLLSTFNTCLDPIIFYFSSSAFRISLPLATDPVQLTICWQQRELQ
uniref:G-protein coupled receptors family 1 profile domain-containing protein n=1 Tax=Periophthalmus magnuspinnatus TaxID=409849 RepID=A0A3B4AJ97_9GOBI